MVAILATQQKVRDDQSMKMVAKEAAVVAFFKIYLFLIKLKVE